MKFLKNGFHTRDLGLISELFYVVRYGLGLETDVQLIPSEHGAPLQQPCDEFPVPAEPVAAQQQDLVLDIGLERCRFILRGVRVHGRLRCKTEKCERTPEGTKGCFRGSCCLSGWNMEMIAENLRDGRAGETAEIDFLKSGKKRRKKCGGLVRDKEKKRVGRRLLNHLKKRALGFPRQSLCVIYNYHASRGTKRGLHEKSTYGARPLDANCSFCIGSHDLKIQKWVWSDSVPPLDVGRELGGNGGFPDAAVPIEKVRVGERPAVSETPERPYPVIVAEKHAVDT